MIMYLIKHTIIHTSFCHLFVLRSKISLFSKIAFHKSMLDNGYLVTLCGLINHVFLSLGFLVVVVFQRLTP